MTDRIRRRTTPRWLWPAVAATVAVGGVAGTMTLIGDAGPPSYSSWSADPMAVTGHDLGVTTAVCHRKLRDSSLDVDRATLALAERRGGHVALLFRTDDPDTSGACLLEHTAGSDRVGHVAAGIGGSTGRALSAPPRGYTQGVVSQFDGASITDGAVGDEVVGVTIHAGDLVVEATLDRGRYTAWWPGPAFSEPPDGGPPRFLLTYDLELQDGTVVRDAPPTVPS